MVDRVQTHEAPEPESQEYVQEMIQKAENANSVKANDPDRPSWLPEKFNNAEDLAQAYSQLEKEFHSNRQSQAPQQVNQQAPQSEVQEQQATQDEARNFIEDKGLSFDKYYQEYNQEGGLTGNSYNELAKAGIPKEMVNSWIEGQQALQERFVQSAYSEVGGQENFKNMVEWATNSLPSEEVDAFNRAMDSSNPSDSMFAIKNLNARYMAENSQPNLLRGDTGTPSTGRFNSLAEMREAMADPKYVTDSAFRDQVAQKLARSNLM